MNSASYFFRRRKIMGEDDPAPPTPGSATIGLSL